MSFSGGGVTSIPASTRVLLPGSVSVEDNGGSLSPLTINS